MKTNYINPNYTQLHLAVMAGDIVKVRDLLEISTLGDIKAKSADNYQRTALDIAIESGRNDIALEIVHHEALLKELDACQQMEGVLAQLDSLDFPSTFITHAFLNHDRVEGSILSGR
jgi:hypothetical protein